jgi:hypothetical protein
MGWRITELRIPIFPALFGASRLKRIRLMCGTSSVAPNMVRQLAPDL